MTMSQSVHVSTKLFNMLLSTRICALFIFYTKINQNFFRNRICAMVHEHDNFLSKLGQRLQMTIHYKSCYPVLQCMHLLVP